MRERTPDLRTFSTATPKPAPLPGQRRATGLTFSMRLLSALWIVGLIAAGLSVLISNGQEFWAGVSRTFALSWLCLGVLGGTYFILQRAVSNWLTAPNPKSAGTVKELAYTSDQSDDVFTPDPQAIHSWTDDITRSNETAREPQDKGTVDSDPLGTLADRQTASLLGLLDKLNELSDRSVKQDKR